MSARGRFGRRRWKLGCESANSVWLSDYMTTAYIIWVCGSERMTRPDAGRPGLGPWMERNHGEVNFYLTWFLTRHGYFKAYLYRVGKVSTTEPRKTDVYKRQIYASNLRFLEKPNMVPIVCSVHPKSISYEQWSSHFSVLLLGRRVNFGSNNSFFR